MSEQGTKEFEESINKCKESYFKGKFCSCGKPATLTFAESYTDFNHGNSRLMCQECYNDLIRETVGYKLGRQETLKEVLWKIQYLEARTTTNNDKDWNDLLVWLEEKAGVK